jgi:hypothetical protein
MNTVLPRTVTFGLNAAQAGAAVNAARTPHAAARLSLPSIILPFVPPRSLSALFYPGRRRSVNISTNSGCAAHEQSKANISERQEAGVPVG